VEQGRRLVADGGGAALAVRGGGELVWELHYGEVNLAAGSIWGEEGRRRGLCVELEAAALMAATVVAAAFQNAGRGVGAGIGAE
jgi:hypothetical protein